MLETGINQLAHPHPSIRSRLVEIAISDCPHGCKIYQDPKSKVKVLHHNGTYGCRMTKIAIERKDHAAIFEGHDYWMVPLKERIDEEVWKGLAIKTAAPIFNQMSGMIQSVMPRITEGFQDMAKSMKNVAAHLNPENAQPLNGPGRVNKPIRRANNKKLNAK